MSAKSPLSLYIISSLFCMVGTARLDAASYNVTSSADTVAYPGTAGTLRWALNMAASSGDTITFAPGPFSITLNAPLPPVNNSVVFDGTGNSGVTINGQNLYPAFFFTAGSSTFQNFVQLSVTNCLAHGGDGGESPLSIGGAGGGGGGGLGAGGAFFVYTGANVTVAPTVQNLLINGCGAQGGDGGAYSGAMPPPAINLPTGGGGGGGGIRNIDTLGNSINGGAGGIPATTSSQSGGGGGGGGLGDLTGATHIPQPGSNGTLTTGGDGGAGSGPSGGPGGAGGTSITGNGSAGTAGAATGAGGGGGGGSAPLLVSGANGGAGAAGFAAFGGGGGGGGASNGTSGGLGGTGGDGGFGGGGGGGGPSGLSSVGTVGGSGGFGGGGGGGSSLTSGAASLYGGGTGSFNPIGGGGGGAALGGSVFVAQGSTLTLANITSLNGYVMAGQGSSGGENGVAAGPQVFLMSGGTLGVTLATPVTFSGSIASNLTVGGGDYTSGGLSVSGAGILTLTGNNNYTGTTVVDGASGGGLKIASSANLGYLGNGSGAVFLKNNGLLEINNAANAITLANPITLQTAAGGTIQVNGTGIVTLGEVLAGTALTASGGTLQVKSGNTYTGNTNINGGTLAIPDASGLGTGGASAAIHFTSGTLATSATSYTLPQSISLGGTGGTFSITPLSDGAITTTLTGQITGAGDLTVNGNNNGAYQGILVLSNVTNNYTGNTNVHNGTLQIGNAAHLGASPAIAMNTGILEITTSLTLSQPVSLATERGSAIAVDAGVVAMLNGAITGSAGLTKNGPGQLIFTNPGNTYGNTMISAGTLSLFLNGNVSPFPSLMTINTGAIFDISGITPAFYSTGPLAGFGTVNLGAKEIRANVPITAAFGGTIEGVGGSVTKLGGGVLTLSGNNTYTGGTNLNSGTISIAHDYNLGDAAGPVNFNGGNLKIYDTVADIVTTTRTFNMNANGGIEVTFPLSTLAAQAYLVKGPLVGAGALNKTGDGFLLLSQDSPSYTGAITVSQGSLLVNADFGATPLVTVAQQGLLGGSGTVGPVVNSGFVSPGNSIGTLHVVGDYTQNSTGFLLIEVSGNQSDLLEVTGNASLAGTLDAVLLQGPVFTGQNPYAILTTGGTVTGTFSSIKFFNGLSGDIIYNPQSVLLAVNSNQLFTNSTFLTEHNPIQVSNYLNSLQYYQNGQPISFQEDLIGVITDLAQLSSSQLEKALDQLHPAQFGEFGLVNSDVRSLLSSTFGRHPAEDCCRHLVELMHCENSSVWVEPFGMRIFQKPQGDERGFESETGGAMIGGDYCFKNNLLLGAAVGGHTTYLKWSGGMGNAHLPSVFVGVYADWSKKWWFLEASFTGGYDFYKTKRHIHFQGVHRNAKSHFHGFDWNAHLGAALDFNAGGYNCGPYFDLDYSYLHQNHFTEHGAKSLNLNVEQKNFAFLRAEEGLFFTRSFKTKRGCWAPKMWMALVTSVPLYPKSYKSSFAGQDKSFKVWTYHKTVYRFSPGLELIWSVNQAVALAARYGADLSRGFFEQKADLRFDWNF